MEFIIIQTMIKSVDNMQHKLMLKDLLLLYLVVGFICCFFLIQKQGSLTSNL